MQYLLMATNQPTITSTELRILRHSGWEFHKGLCNIGRGYRAIQLDLARRGYLIALDLPWGVDCYITIKGLTAVWDHACDALQHLRPDADHLARADARIQSQLAFWVARGEDSVGTAVYAPADLQVAA